VFFSRFGELSDEFLGDRLAATCWVNPDSFNRHYGVGNPSSNSPAQADHAIVDLGDQRGPERPTGIKDFDCLVPVLGRADPGLALLRGDDRRYHASPNSKVKFFHICSPTLVLSCG
jgi:hypothetical protein